MKIIIENNPELTQQLIENADKIADEMNEQIVEHRENFLKKYPNTNISIIDIGYLIQRMANIQSVMMHINSKLYSK